MMKKQGLISVCVLALGLVLSPLAAHAAKPAKTAKTAKTVQVVQDATASALVKNFYDQLTNVMKSGEALGFTGRYKKLEPAIKSSFNLPLMTRYAVGTVWVSATPSEQQQLISAFSDFSVATYASRFVKYDGEKFDVLGEKPAADGVMVETRLTPSGAAPVMLNYLVKKDEKGAYRIVDVFLDGAISELATRRSEFGSIARRDGIEALVNSISDKSKHMGPS